MSKIGYPFTFHQSQTPTATDEEVNIEEAPIDTGLIRCICESTEDDGFTIQCDKCLTWQHAFCMNINQDNIPDRYLCNDCVKLVTSLNNQRSSKNNNTLYESTTTTTTDTGLLNNSSTKPYSSKRKEDKNKSTNNRSLSVKPNSHNKRSRETVIQEDYHRSHKTSSKKPKLSKRIPISKRSLQQQQQQQQNTIESDEEENINDNNNNSNNNNSSNNIYDNNNYSHKPLTHHHHHNKKKDKYRHIDFNTISSKFVHEIIKDTIKRWSQSSKWKSQPWRDADQQDISTSSTSRKLQPHEPFIIMDNTSLKQSALNNISIKSLPKHHHHHHHHHHSSRLRKGVFADTQLNANTFLMEVHGEILLKTEYKFDVTNDYAILGTACEHVLFYPTLDLCIDSRQLGNDARYFRRSCHPNAELRTLIFHTNDSSASSLVTDNNNSVINNNNNSNDNNNNNKSIRLGVFTRTNIDQGEEITLGWNWQKGHISWRKNVEWYRSSHLDQSQNKTFIHDTEDDKLQFNSLNQLQQHQQHRSDNKIDEKLEIKSHYAIELMMERFDDEFGNCACGDRDVCLIEQLRQECLLSNNINNNNNDNDSQINGRSSSLESTASIQQQQKLQETGKSLQRPDQIILPSKIENEKLSSANSPAPGSVEENVDIDVISMSPITSSPIISMSHPIIDQIKKSTIDNRGTGDDVLDIDSDVDIENKLYTGQKASPPHSTSSSGLCDEESNSNIDGNIDDDHHINKKRKHMIKSEQDNHDDTMLKKNTVIKSKKPAVLPCKKIWAKNFSQRDLKIENNSSTLIVSEVNTQEKTYSINNTTKIETSSTSYETSSHQNAKSNNDLSVKESSYGIKPEADIDEGELSDASSASTLPLEEDDRNWSLREPSHTSTPINKNNDHSETTTDITINKNQNHNHNTLESSSPSSSSTAVTSLDTVNELKQQNNNSDNNNNEMKSAVVDKDIKNYISDTKSISPNINEPSKIQQQVESPSSIVKNELSPVKEKAATPEINDNKDADQTKPPTKVKVSLQEYLSRRLANQDSPSQ